MIPNTKVIAWITSKLFLDQEFSQAKKAFGEAILARIVDHFVEQLRNVPWMSKENRELAIEKCTFFHS